MRNLLLTFGIAAGILYFAASTHVVKTSDGLKLYPKKELTLEDTYTDMTQLSLLELQDHMPVVRAMIDNGDIDQLPGGDALSRAGKAAQSFMNSISKGDRD